jgi:hypothetical protein
MQIGWRNWLQLPVNLIDIDVNVMSMTKLRKQAAMPFANTGNHR